MACNKILFLNPYLPSGHLHLYQPRVHFQSFGCLVYFFIFILFRIEISVWKQCRPHVLRCLIWDCIVCQGPKNGTLGIKGLSALPLNSTGVSDLKDKSKFFQISTTLMVNIKHISGWTIKINQRHGIFKPEAHGLQRLAWMNSCKSIIQLFRHSVAMATNQNKEFAQN